MTYRVYATSARRRRRALGRAAFLAVLLLALALVWTRAGAVESQPTERGERTAAGGKPLGIAWPAEGQAAVAVAGIGGLGTSGGGEPVPIASVAKAMTAYLVLREHPLGPGEQGFQIEISQADVEELHERVELDQSVVAVEAGEVLSERQALEALMLPSANNVAALLAVHEAGSVEAFAAEMNEAAAELGMDDTHYTDPSGWEASTVSTAADQLKLARAAMADPTFAEIVALPATVLPVAGEVTNYNRLVGHDGFVGIKTGSHEAAGGCLLFAKRVEVEGRTRLMLGAVLGQRQGGDLVAAALASADRLAASAVAALRPLSAPGDRRGAPHRSRSA